MKIPNEAELREKVSDLNMSFWSFQRPQWTMLTDSQKAKGKNPNSVGSVFSRLGTIAANTVLLPLIAGGKFKDGLTLRGQFLFASLHGPQDYAKSVEFSTDPLYSSLQSALHEAVREKLMPSLAALKKAVGQPLIDEEVVRAVREEAIAKSYARFDLLAEQSFGKAAVEQTRIPLDFSADQIVDGVTFGIELEGFNITDDTFIANMMNMQKLFKASGLPTESFAFMPKMSGSYDKWNVTMDPSIVNPLYYTGNQDMGKKMDGMGIEIVSPVLSGPKGVKDVEKVISLGSVFDFRTNDTTGMHLHVGLTDTTFEQRKNLAKALVKNEEVFDRLVDPKRRGSGNKFSQSHCHVDIAQIDAAQSDEELVEIMNPGQDRNYKFDFTNLLYEDSADTIQYRGEGGAAYIENTPGYIITLVNFTKQALDNPYIDLATVISDLGGDVNADTAPLSEELTVFTDGIQAPQPSPQGLQI